MDDKQARRVDVMLEWRDGAVAAGHAVPSEADVIHIAAAGEPYPAGVDVAAVQPWRDTIAFLLKMLKLRAPDPVAQLPDDLRTPATVPSRGPATPPGSVPRHAAPAGARPAAPQRVEDPALAALRAWRLAELPDNPELEGLKDAALQRIALTGSRTEAEISRHLPSGLTGFAATMAQVVVGSVPPAAPDPTPVSQPTLPRPSAPHPTAPPPPARSPSAPPRPVPPPEPTARQPAPSRVLAPAYLTEAPTRADGIDDVDEIDELSTLALAPYSELLTDKPSVTVKTAAAVAGTELSWARLESPAATVLYRVVSRDDGSVPEAPQRAAAVAVTEDLRCVDVRPFQGPVRQYQVWCHAGATREQAAAAAPVLHAGAAVVARVGETYIGVVDDKRVVGEWTVPAGVERVYISRSTVGHDDEVEILGGQDNLTGFVDDAARRGNSYVYQVAVEAKVPGDGRQLSAKVRLEIYFPVELVPVADLQVTQHLETYDLSWTPPKAGRLVLFRAPVEPKAGATERAVQTADLKSLNLGDDHQLRLPRSPGSQGRECVQGVTWPKGWTTAYLTPVVTMPDGQAMVGPTRQVVKLPPVRDPEIVERFHRQLLTFGWPQDATRVAAYVGPTGVPADQLLEDEPQVIDKDHYERFGGLQFRNRLSPTGNTVHVAPVTFYENRRQMGPPVALEYPGLTRLQYAVTIDRDPGGRPVSVNVWFFVEKQTKSRFQFRLLHHPERLPLFVGDGTPVKMAPVGYEEGVVPATDFEPLSIPPFEERGVGFWTGTVQGLSGFVRVFVLPDRNRRIPVALMDPPMDQLRLTAPEPPADPR